MIARNLSYRNFFPVCIQIAVVLYIYVCRCATQLGHPQGNISRAKREASLSNGISTHFRIHFDYRAFEAALRECNAQVCERGKSRAKISERYRYIYMCTTFKASIYIRILASLSRVRSSGMRGSSVVAVANEP